jgi:cbb3-type cytochrome oxidase maturation protein
MSVMLILILFSISTALIFLAAFVWAVKSGQFEDDYTPSVRILMEETPPAAEPVNDTSIQSLKSNTHASGKV